MNAQTFVLVDQFQDTLKDFIKSTNTKPKSDVAIDVYVDTVLPQIVSLGQVVMADGRLDLFELIRIVRFTSETLRDGLNIYTESNTVEKLGIAREIIQFLVKNLIPGDTKLKKFVLDDANIEPFISFVYQLTVKIRLGR